MDIKHFSNSFEKLIALWIVRSFPYGCISQGFCGTEFDYNIDYEIFEQDQESIISTFIGLPNEITRGSDEDNYAYMNHLREFLERESASMLPRVRENFSQFSDVYGLNEVEKRIVEFLACSLAVPVLEALNTFEFSLDSEDSYQIAHLSRVLLLDFEDVAEACAVDGRLRKYGIICGTKECEKIFEFFSLSVARRLLWGTFQARDILGVYCVVKRSHSNPYSREMEEIAHFMPGLNILVDYLINCQELNHPRINVLIRGSSIEQTNMLIFAFSRILKIKQFEVRSRDYHFNPLAPCHRLAALSLAQLLLKNEQALIIYDQAE
jgi:hypothetical protein